MRRIYVSTVGRGKNKEEASRVYCVDYDTGKTLMSHAIPIANIDLSATNPRGGTRGARGLCWYNSRLWVAGWDGLFELDPDTLRVERGFWSDECWDIHQIYAGQFEITCVGTWTNSIYKFSEGKFTKVKDLTEIHPGEFQAPSPDRLHFNAMSGRYANLNTIGAIADMKTGELVVEDPEIFFGTHDLIELPTNELVINLSRLRKTVTLNMDTWEIQRTLVELPEVKQPAGTIMCMPGWMRGASYIPKHDTLLLGTAPARVLAIENVSTATGKNQFKEIKISDDIVDSVFDVIPHPWDWR
jgi:hypothetical protein